MHLVAVERLSYHSMQILDSRDAMRSVCCDYDAVQDLDIQLRISSVTRTESSSTFISTKADDEAGAAGGMGAVSLKITYGCVAFAKSNKLTF